MPKRLEIRIITSLAFVLAAMIAVYGWWVGNNQTKIYVQSLSDNLRSLSHSHADNAAHYIVVEEYAGLDEHMLEAARLPEILSVQVLELDGTLLCNIARQSRAEKPRLIYSVKRASTPKGSEASINREGNSLVSWTPIVAGSHLGWLKMTLSLNTANDLLKTTWRSTLQIGILWLLVGIALMVLVVRKPLSTIRELSLFAHDLQSRKGGQVSVPRGVFEIDLLADALNHSSAELQSAERLLVAQQEQLSVTLQSIGDGVISTDISCIIILLNHVAEQLTGWPQEQAQGQKLNDVLCLEKDDGVPAIEEQLQSVLKEKRPIELSGQIRLVSRDKIVFLVIVNGTPIIDSAGQLAGMVLVIRNVTEKAEMEAEKRKLEEQLIQSQKMESIGQLAGGIAHDFNNILTAINGYGEMLRSRVANDEKLASFADQLLAAAGRAANLTRSLLAFSRKQSIELVRTDINGVVNGVQKFLGRLIGEDIILSAHTTATPLLAMVDAGQLEQILMNLATNARDAMPEGGNLSIETDEIFVDALYSNAVAAAKPGRYALITVSDNGNGMDQKTCARIFEPFFTTKNIGKGTGLGLSIVYGIVRQHNGFITVYSEPGHGTSFRIHIPLSEGPEMQAIPDDNSENLHGSETILLVEDDNDVRDILSLTMGEAGYTIISATCGAEAVKLFDENHDRISLVLMDVIMPGMNGKEAYSRISERYPSSPVIFMSGYTSDIILHKGIVDMDINFIHKPVSKQQLLKKVRGVLDGNSRPVSTDTLTE